MMVGVGESQHRSRLGREYSHAFVVAAAWYLFSSGSAAHDSDNLPPQPAVFTAIYLEFEPFLSFAQKRSKLTCGTIRAAATASGNTWPMTVLVCVQPVGSVW